jgi:hypothetical protein
VQIDFRAYFNILQHNSSFYCLLQEKLLYLSDIYVTIKRTKYRTDCNKMHFTLPCTISTTDAFYLRMALRNTPGKKLFN